MNDPRIPVFLCSTLLLTAGPVMAADFSSSIEVDLVSQYVWRGVLMDDEESLQPSVTLGYAFTDRFRLDLNGWWNIALDDHGSDDHQDLLFEQDFTLTLSYAFTERFGMSAGYVYFSNPRSDVAPGTESYQTSELLLGARYETDLFFVDGTIYADVDAVKGYYVDLNSGLTFDLGGGFTMASGIHFGLAWDLDPNPDDPAETWWFIDDGLVEGNASLAFAYKLGDNFSLGVAAYYSRRFDDWEEVAGGDDHYTWGKVSFGAYF